MTCFSLSRFICAAVAVLTCSLSQTAFAQVNLARFGLTDVAEVATCVSQRIPSYLSQEIVVTYWGPAVLEHNQCVNPYTEVDNDVRTKARTAFLSALSSCTNQNVRDDDAPMTRRIAYAAAVIAAHGIQDWSTNKRLVDKYVAKTIACQGTDTADGASQPVPRRRVSSSQFQP